MTLPNPPQVSQAIPNQPFYSPETPATFDLLSGVLTPNIQLVPNPDDNAGGNGWVRSSDWLPMPDVSPAEEKFVGLYAIYNTPENFIAVYFEGDYVVDWGDGNINFILSGVKAQHSYSWNDIPGSTLTSEGYKQVLVTVTPYPGDSLTVMDLTVRHDFCSSLSNAPWLDLKVSLPEASSGASIIFSAEYVGLGSGYLQSVERIHILNSGEFSYMQGLFCYMPSLSSVPLFDTSKATSMENMFAGCNSLSSTPEFDTSLVTNMYGMFRYCYALTSVPNFNTSLVTNMYGMFQNCLSLNSVTSFDTSSVTIISDIFETCRSLQKAAFYGTSVDISYSECTMGRQAIVDIFNGLANADATINVQGNYGAADLTPSDIAIATDKGWIVLY